jgi:energy-converting hydrogenase Eha subunit E
MVLGFGKNAPVLMVLYGNIQGVGVDARALATINALAVLCNAAIAAMSLLSLMVIWRALVRRAIWAVWALAACVLLLQGASFVCDWMLHDPDVLGNSVAFSIPATGVVLAALGVSRTSATKAQPAAGPNERERGQVSAELERKP